MSIDETGGSRFEVLIVGAGAAGLAAGCALARAGRRVAVIEARARVGGRIFTDRLALSGTDHAVPVELGAEFIHGVPGATFDLVRRARLETSEMSGTPFAFEDGRLTADAAATNPDAAGEVLDQMAAWLALQPAGFDTTFADYLRRATPEAAAAASNYVEGFNAADRERIGVAALAKQQRAEDAIEGDRLFRLPGGYDAIPRFLAAELSREGGTVFLAKPVRRIAWRRGAVHVQGADAAGQPFEFIAPRAIITVPLGVLQAETIRFEPRPEAILRHANRLAMGAAARAVLIFSSRFWCERMGFLFVPGKTPTTWWTPHPEPLPQLTAWAGGPKAAAWQNSIAQSGEPEAQLQSCLDTLVQVFHTGEPDLRKLLRGWRAHDWLHDEFSRGSYSYVPAGALDAPAGVGVPAENTLFFAGEHTDLEGHWGTVHAALASGTRAAVAVAESLSP